MVQACHYTTELGIMLVLKCLEYTAKDKFSIWVSFFRPTQGKEENVDDQAEKGQPADTSYKISAESIRTLVATLPLLESLQWKIMIRLEKTMDQLSLRHALIKTLGQIFGVDYDYWAFSSAF